MTRLFLLSLTFVCAAVVGLANDSHGVRTWPSPYTTGETVAPLTLTGADSQPLADAYASDAPLIVVRYLGYSCAHCVEQLTYLNRKAEALKELGVKVIAFSSDNAAQNERLITKMEYDREVISILSDPGNVAAKAIGAVRTSIDTLRDLHAALVVYDHKVLFGVYSEQPYMDVERLVATAVHAKERAGKSEDVQELGSHTLDKYLSEGYSVSNVYGPADGVNGPVDLEFNKSPLSPNDLWVVTTSNPGHGIALVHDAPFDHRSLKLKKDSRASHFMWRTMAISMGPDGSFATAQNGENGGFDPFYQFMGPTLWSSDTAIFAQRNQSSRRLLGSHLDMLHQSPQNLGIAHERDNVYWVSDGFYNDITRFDFADPHEFGGHDHRDGIIRRYSEARVGTPERGRPGHMAFDADKKWLYYVDPGNNTVMRLDVTTGALKAPLTMPNASRENLAEYTEYEGTTVETVVSEGLGEPVGIHVDGDRLLVGDRVSGDILMYDLSTQPVTLLGKLFTGAQELLGITVGPDQRIWFADRGASVIGVLKTRSDHQVSATLDVVAAPKTTTVEFNYTNTSNEMRSVTLNPWIYASTAEGEGERMSLGDPVMFNVDADATTSVMVPVTLPDNIHAFRVEVVEDNGTSTGGTRAHVMLVPADIKRAIVEDAMTELNRITPAMEQTDRVGYVSIRADLFLRIADQLDSLETVVWNGGTMGELSTTDDAILNSLIAREIEVLLIADDPLIMRSSLPLSSAFFNKFGVRMLGADVRDPDNGQRVFDGVPSDEITDGMTMVDCQLPRLDHDRGGRYTPNVLFATSDEAAAPILVRANGTSIGSVRFEEGYRRSVILGINIGRFQDGFQRAELLDKTVEWLENAPREIIEDTTTSVDEQLRSIGVSMAINGNPASTSTTIVLDGDAGFIDVGLYTVSGQKLGSVYNGPISGPMTVPVDVSAYARGTIFVIARTARGTIHSTFIKL